MNPIVLEVWRGRTLVTRSEHAEPSVTIGSGPSAMVCVEDPALAELHAVVNVEDDGSLLVLDLGSGQGVVVNGATVQSSPIASGGTFGIGALTFRVTVGAGDEEYAEEQPTSVSVQALPPSAPAPAAAAPAVHAEVGHEKPADDHGHEKEDIADVVSFVMRTSNAAPAAGEKRRPPLLEVHQMWGNALLSTRQFPRDAKEVHIGLRSGYRWSFLGIDMGWIPTPLTFVLPLMTPMWSDIENIWKSDFVVSREMLPEEQDWTLFEQNAEGVYVAKVAAGWDGFADVDGKRMTFPELVAAGLANESAQGLEIPLTENMKLMVEGGGSVFFAQMASPVPRAFVKMNEEQDWVFAGMLGFGGFVFLTVLALMYISPPTHSQESNEIPDRLVELLLDKPEEEKKDKKPAGNPDAGEGAKAKKEEGKVGKKEAKMDKAKGNKVEVKQLEIDRQVAENAGVLGAMNNGDLNQVLGSSGLSSDLTGGIGGLIGASGTQIGSGGLGGRGSGLGGGGTAEGLGGLGTKGMGSGSSGYGKGGGDFGAKGEGGIGTVGGDPIILGALDRSLIDEVIKRNMNQIRYCYQRELTKNPALGGKIVIKFTIAKDGTVSAASTKTTTMNNASVESCIVGRFLRMQFPQPKGGGIVIVSYPFIFSPG